MWATTIGDGVNISVIPVITESQQRTQSSRQHSAAVVTRLQK